ncbi:MAG: Nif11-like leader peptide family natural product precursor [Chloroflexi bacterium]|uniref:Nif11-like leader peptide family natural product n=1 Tax=Candidatus Chlorohelix allophototropha TaxID=3003348 RepID=A0A8T7M1T9_9CHLR|nr:Nif11-like leader peptide family natural product precursor [Chloroflexota bacterium]WJW65585.1 Nif11-like leader peptide family natural product precursor [Chloroflexota bacterium L227-S17]
MSEQAASEFLENMDKDDALRSKVVSLGNNISADVVVALAAENGYSFTSEELIAAGSTRIAPGASGELPDEALDQVAGGGSVTISWGSRNIRGNSAINPGNLNPGSMGGIGGH